MSDATLFDAPRARATDPETSHQAAAAITGAVEAWVLRAHEQFSWLGGMTDDSLVVRLPKLYPPTVKSARSRLSKRGLLIDSGERRPSDRGRAQIVWRLA